jgi:6-phosphogluconolactonase
MIRIYPDSELLSQAAAELFIAQARQAVTERGRFCVALSGGSTPQNCYHLLAREPFRDQVPWSQVEIFWGDERCVAQTDPRSNAGSAKAALLDMVPLSPEQIHPMVCAGDSHAAAQNYQRLLQDFFHPTEPRFDLILLGLGEDGHTASLIPGTPAPEERLALVTALQKPGEDFARLSLTAPAINLARLVVFLVSGAGKAPILHQVLSGRTKKYPAQLISPQQGALLWLVDQEAVNP